MNEIAIKKRKQLTLSEKLTLLNSIENGKKLTVAAREFGISNSTASGIMKDRLKIKLLHEHYKLAPHRKRMRLSLYSDVDEAVLMWFRQMRSKNTPVNGPMLQQKARDFGKLLGHNNFEGSSGWLFRFRERHDMSVESMRGENAECISTSVGMTDEEIVSSVNQINSAQTDEEIVSCINHTNSAQTDEEIVSCINHTNSAQTEYIVSNVDVYDTAEENPLNLQSKSSNSCNIQPISFCDSTEEVQNTHGEVDKSSSMIKLSEAVSLVKSLTSFFEQQKEIPKCITESLNAVSDFILNDLPERLKQKKITDYYK